MIESHLPSRERLRRKYDYSSRRAGSHVALFDGDFTRCSISPRSSSRNRAQSARRSSDTNSPGGSGWRSRGDPASGAGPDTESPPRCGNCGKSCFCNRRCRARTSKSRRQVDSTVVRAAVGSPERVTLRRSSERARTLLAARDVLRRSPSPTGPAALGKKPVRPFRGRTWRPVPSSALAEEGLPESRPSVRGDYRQVKLGS
jgi:hypothetical protein